MADSTIEEAVERVGVEKFGIQTTSSSSTRTTRAATKTSTRCSARRGRGRRRCGMSRGRLRSALAPSRRSGKQLWRWQPLERAVLRTFRAKIRAVPHGAREVRLAFALPSLLVPCCSFLIVRLSPCAGKRKLEALQLTAPLAPSFYNLSFSTPPLPMATLQPLGAAERERAFAACTSSGRGRLYW